MDLSQKNWQAVVREAAARAVGEDIGPVDLTSRVAVPLEARAVATLVAREPCVVAGMEVAEAVFREVDGGLQWRPIVKDGDRMASGSVAAEITGSARSILSGERCALNFLQRLSGIATLTADFVRAVQGTKARILDTRKTTPGLRALERKAVLAGGGVNHRAGLYDAILMKENHQVFLPKEKLGEVIQSCRREFPDFPLVVEADSVDLAIRLLRHPLDRVLLDNMSVEQVALVIQKRSEMGSQVDLEASGGVTLERVRELALTGVEWISVGSLTHSARAIDLSLDIQKAP
jgi:nicotinate-nucleotide pyrophosphorylase (carboxylating)